MGLSSTAAAPEPRRAGSPCCQASRIDAPDIDVVAVKSAARVWPCLGVPDRRGTSREQDQTDNDQYKPHGRCV